MPSAVDYWKENASLAHITPADDKYPEGDILGIVSRLATGSVCEFGCGYGRLSPAFSPDQYHGYDINHHALSAAREANPEYSYSDEMRPADTAIAHTVLLHVDDESIVETAAMLNQYDHLVIGEVMGRKWRRSGNPPVFNRDKAEYIEMFGPMSEYRVYLKRYNDHLTFLYR